MIRYFVRRLLLAGVVMLLVLVATFLIVRLVPGDPARIALGAQATNESVTALREDLGLDEPVTEQFVTYVGDVVNVDFGDSLTRGVPVSDLVGPRIAPSLFLIGYSLVIGSLVAVPMAVVSARRHNRWPDHGIRAFSFVALAMPSFWFGILLAYLFGLQAGLFPISGYGEGFWGHLRSLTLPAVTLGLSISPLLIRTLRASLLETFQSSFVEAARSRGLGEQRILLHHVFRNSLAATVTVIAFLISVLLGGTIVIENVFSIPGMGSLLVQSVIVRDFPVIQLLALIFATVVVLASLLSDIAYASLDPRVRL